MKTLIQKLGFDAGGSAAPLQESDKLSSEIAVSIILSITANPLRRPKAGQIKLPTKIFIASNEDYGETKRGQFTRAKLAMGCLL